MKVFKGTWTGVDILQPGRKRPDIDAWREAMPTDTGMVHAFKTVQVRFVRGVAEVDERLGQFMIEHGHATTEPTPPGIEPVAAGAEPAQFVPPSEYDLIPDTDRMRVYGGGRHGTGTVFVTPGRDHPEVPGWRKTDRLQSHDGHVIRHVDKQFTVQFIDGIAEVDRNLGHYLIRQGLAWAWPVAWIGAQLDSRFDGVDAPVSHSI
jgi:hypothetical protein